MKISRQKNNIVQAGKTASARGAASVRSATSGRGAASARVRWEFAVMAVIIIVMFLNPFAKYTYNGGVYTVNGLNFISGGTFCGGKVVIEPDLFFILSLIGLAAVLIGSLLFPVFKARVGFRIIGLGALVNLVCNIKFAMDISNIFRRAKDPGIGYGCLVSLILMAVILIASLYSLWSLKILSTLDFMALPGMMYFIIDRYIPMLGITIAFKKVDYSLGVWDSPWVGLENFKMLFSHRGSIFDSDAFIITRNTLLYNAVFIFLGILVGVLVGICLSDLYKKTLQRFFQTSILLPQLISMVIVAYIVFAFLGNETGMINSMLDEPINFYQEPKYWPFILVFIYVWKQVGYNSIIFLSAIVGIDQQLYEAAKVDGASKWQQIRFVTLPMLKSTIITLLLLQVGRIFYSDFGLFYQVPLDSGALYDVTNTVDTYVYRSLMVLNNVSIASAGSTYQAIVGFVLVFCVNLVVRKMDRENALF